MDPTGPSCLLSYRRTSAGALSHNSGMIKDSAKHAQGLCYQDQCFKYHSFLFGFYREEGRSQIKHKVRRDEIKTKEKTEVLIGLYELYDEHSKASSRGPRLCIARRSSLHQTYLGSYRQANASGRVPKRFSSTAVSSYACMLQTPALSKDVSTG